MLFVALLPAGVRAAAWPLPAGRSVLSVTILADVFDQEQLESSNSRLLEEEGGSVVQTGRVGRAALFLLGEIGLAERVTASIGASGVWSRHAEVGPNLARWTNASPNTIVTLQDFHAAAQYAAYCSGEDLPFCLSPTVGVTIPLVRYDTTVHNGAGDGLASANLGLSGSMLFFRRRAFCNIDVAYRLRDKASFRTGTVFTREQLRSNSQLEELGFRAGGTVHDQFTLHAEGGFFLTGRLSLRLFGKWSETLGGENLTFRGMATMEAMGVAKMPMFENAAAYDQDVVFLGIGPYFQMTPRFGAAFAYTHAVWFRNYPNVKSLTASLSAMF